MRNTPNKKDIDNLSDSERIFLIECVKLGRVKKCVMSEREFVTAQKLRAKGFVGDAGDIIIPTHHFGLDQLEAK
jgi:hypothetical protein